MSPHRDNAVANMARGNHNCWTIDPATGSGQGIGIGVWKRQPESGKSVQSVVKDSLIDFQRLPGLRHISATPNPLSTNNLQLVLASRVGHFGHPSGVTETFFHRFAQEKGLVGPALRNRDREAHSSFSACFSFWYAATICCCTFGGTGS